MAVMMLLAGLLCGLPATGLAVPEGELAASFAERVRPFFEENFTLGSFQGVAGLVLHYAKRQVPNPRGVLVVVNGRTEFLAKYAELFYDLRDLPWSFYIFDQRGQGRSGRLLADRAKGHVVDFQDYVTDLAIFIDTVVKPDRKLPLGLLTHSMGGTVAAHYANRHPDAVQGLILSAPMLDINTAPIPTFLVRLLAQGATVLGFAGSLVPGWRLYTYARPFSANYLTHSQVRFRLNQELLANDPDNTIGNPTFGWLHQALSGMDTLLVDHRQLTMPVLLLRAGGDTVVRTRPQADFCAELSDCTLVDLPGARHEILMEEDVIRDRALAAIRDFVDRLAPVQHRQGLNRAPVQHQQGLNRAPVQHQQGLNRAPPAEEGSP